MWWCGDRLQYVTVCRVELGTLLLVDGCFRCGKEGHFSRECPDATANTGEFANNGDKSVEDYIALDAFQRRVF